MLATETRVSVLAMLPTKRGPPLFPRAAELFIDPVSSPCQKRLLSGYNKFRSQGLHFPRCRLIPFSGVLLFRVSYPSAVLVTIQSKQIPFQGATSSRLFLNSFPVLGNPFSVGCILSRSRFIPFSGVPLFRAYCPTAVLVTIQ